MGDDPEDLFAALAAGMGAPPFKPEEVAAMLRLAKAADASERRFAPITCYAAGLVIGASGADEDGRIRRLREMIDRVHLHQAEGSLQGDEDHGSAPG